MVTQGREDMGKVDSFTFGKRVANSSKYVLFIGQIDKLLLPQIP